MGDWVWQAMEFHLVGYFQPYRWEVGRDFLIIFLICKEIDFVWSFGPKMVFINLTGKS